MVTAPVLVVEPVAMVSLVLVLRVKSEAVAGDTAVADTVTVTAALDTTLRSAVMVLEPPFSEIDDLLSASDTVGRPSTGGGGSVDGGSGEDGGSSSSSVIVPVAVSVSVTLTEVPETARPTVKVSLVSTVVSSVVETVKLCCSPAVPAKVRADVFSV